MESDRVGSRSVSASGLEVQMQAHPSAFAVIVSGPSGVGKNALCSRVLQVEPQVRPCVTTTTRLPRTGEVDGTDYHFTCEADFRAGIGRGEFVEWAEVYGALYGATVSAVERALDSAAVMLLDVDVQGAAAWKQALARRCVTVFVLPPSIEALIQRLRGRNTEGPAALERRCANVTKELSHAHTFDYALVNHDVEQAAEDLRGVIRAERLRPWRMTDAFGALNEGAANQNP